MTAKTAAPAADRAAAAIGLTRLRSLPTRLLAQSAAHGDRLVTEALSAENARKWHYAVLTSLLESGPASQATISRRTCIYRSDLVAVINELAERDLVERTPDAGDRRRNVITLTQRGRDHLIRLDGLVSEVQDALLAPLDQAERAQLVGLLTKLTEHHGNQWS